MFKSHFGVRDPAINCLNNFLNILSLDLLIPDICFLQIIVKHIVFLLILELQEC